jgi:hypothetical protein
MRRHALLIAVLLAGSTGTTKARPVEHAHDGHGHARPLLAPTLIGRWGDWRAATHRAAGAVVCYAYTRTTSSSVKLPGRGDVVLTVTERPGSPRDAVALSAGFLYPPGSKVDVTAGTVRAAFYTAQRSAFARSGPEIVHAFGAVRTASARSPAPRGRAVTDVFSMNGFADAHAAILKACPQHV